jgi:hypothetical protein
VLGLKRIYLKTSLAKTDRNKPLSRTISQFARIEGRMSDDLFKGEDGSLMVKDEQLLLSAGMNAARGFPLVY